MRPCLTLCVIAALASCSQFPQLDDSVSAQAQLAPYPDLVPVEDLLASIPEATITPALETDLAARIAALRARAARLRHTVIDPATRTRMRDGIS